MSKVYSFIHTQVLPISLKEAWAYFSSPKNLQKITPEKMGFQIISPDYDGEIYAGQVIEYKVRPVANIPLYWMTEITHVMPGKYFIDEQRYGPYSMWHHQHHFKEMGDGKVEMTDIVHYKIPFGFFGSIANSLFVKKEVEEIFNYRKKKLVELWG